MISAMEAVKPGEKGVKQGNTGACNSKNHLERRVKHRKNPGPSPFLTNEKENELASFLTKACKLGQRKLSKVFYAYIVH